MNAVTKKKENFLFNYFYRKLADSMFIYFFTSILLISFFYSWLYLELELNWFNVLFLLFFSLGASKFICGAIAHFIMSNIVSTLSGSDMYIIENRKSVKLEKLKKEKESLEKVLSERKYEPGINTLRKKLVRINAKICIEETELKLFLY